MTGETNLGAFQILLQLKDEAADKMKSTVATILSVGTAVAVVTKALEDQAEAEAGINKLNQTLANQGKLANSTTKEFLELAQSLTDVSTYTDDSILSVETQFVALGKSRNEVERLTRATINYAAYTRQDLSTAMGDVSRGLNGSARAFKLYGIEIDSGADKTTRMNQLIGQMEAKFGGSAQAATQTMSGQITILKRELGEASESFGKFLGSLSSGNSVIPTVTEWIKEFSTFLGGKAIIAMSEFRAQLNEMLASVLNRLADFGESVQKLPFFGKGVVDKQIVTASKETRELAKSLDESAKKLREAGDAAAASTGKLVNHTNKTKEQVAAERALAESIAATAKAREKAEQELASYQAKLRQKTEERLEEVNKELQFKVSDEILSSFEKTLNSYIDKIPIMTQRKFTGMAPPQGNIGVDTRPWISDLNQTGSLTDMNTKKTIDWSEALQDVSNAFQAMGISADNSFSKIVVGFMAGMAAAEKFKASTKNSEKAMIGLGVAVSAYQSGKWGGAAQGAAFGSQFGPYGALIGGVAGFALGWIGDTRRAAAETKKLRESFIDAKGGMDELQYAADKAGISLDKLFSTKNPKELAKVIKDLENSFNLNRIRQDFIDSQGGLEALKFKAEEAGISLDKLFDTTNALELQDVIKGIIDQLDTQKEAQRLLNEAIDRYGITIEELGPKFAQQKLDEMAMQLLRDYELLIAAGVSNDTVLTKMAGDFSILAQNALKTGAAIPEALRGPLQRLIELGLLTGEDGEKLKSLEGINFEDNLNKSIKDVIAAIRDLVNALKGIPPVVNSRVNVDINYTYTGDDPDPEKRRPPGRAGGFHGWLTRPTLMLAGEAGGERVDISPGTGTGHGMSGDAVVGKLSSIENLLRGQRVVLRDMVLLGKG